MNKKYIVILAILAVGIFALGVHLATAGPVEVQIGDNTISFLPLVMNTKADQVNSAISVSAAAFRPEDNTMGFTNHGNVLYDYSGPGENYYHAPVQLPHGAIITDMTCYYNDSDTYYDFYCWLYRTPMEGTTTSLIAAQSSGYPGDDSTTEKCLTNCQVDNSMYSYFLTWEIDSESMMGFGVVITYDVSALY
jgi:hypothetical protein